MYFTFDFKGIWGINLKLEVTKGQIHYQLSFRNGVTYDTEEFFSSLKEKLKKKKKKSN